jgi:flagella basal body P-ring formation protein FlgA
MAQTTHATSRKAGQRLRHAGVWLLAALLGTPVTAQPAVQDLQPLDEIAAAAASHALSLLETGNWRQVEARAQPLDERLRLRRCDQPLQLGSTSQQVKPGRVAISVRCNGSTPWSLFVPVQISAQAQVVMLRGPLPRGTVLGPEHLELRELPAERLPPNHLDRPEAVVGHELLRAVNQDTVATAFMLKPRKLVEKGQNVVILAQAGRLEVKMAGVALQPGQQGERIEVRNLASGRTIQARISSADTVVIQM